MEQKTTTCPACGAPIKYTEDEETLRCGYCDADLRVVRKDGEELFEIISQPEPQKEVLSHPVIPQASATSETTGASAPSFFTEPPQSEPFRPEQPIPAPPDFTGAGQTGAQVYPPAQATTPRGGVPSWLWIVLGVIGGLCLLCACLAVVMAVLFNYSTVNSF
jgi:hypothetical protein